MKVNVLSLKQMPLYNIEKHIVELKLGRHFENPSTNMLVIASIGAGYNHYKYKMNLFERYSKIESVRTNDKYDADKAWKLCQQEFPINSAIEWDGELYDLKVQELFDNKYTALESVQDRRRIYTFYRAGLGHNREEVKQECKRNLSYLIEIGVLKPIND